MGFDQINAENYLRFPIWIMYLVKPNWTFLELKHYIDKINDPRFRLNLNRNRGFSLLAGHDGNGVRRYFLELLNNIETIHCPGKFNHNTDELQLHYNNDKLAYLTNFKFNICPENTSTDFYVTEKIFDAIAGGCIPIYWGNGSQLDVEPMVLNQRAILRHTGNNERELLENILRLYFSEKDYKEFVNIKPFQDSAAEIIWSELETLADRLRSIMT